MDPARSALLASGVMASTSRNAAGETLRAWRQRRRLSQLELASRTGVSTRHLSCLETGKANGSKQLLLYLAEELDVPLRDRNELLLAAGYAPRYPHQPLDGQRLSAARTALAELLAGHEPYPAVVMDRHWNVVERNRTAVALMTGVSPELPSHPSTSCAPHCTPVAWRRRSSTCRTGAHTCSAGSAGRSG